MTAADPDEARGQPTELMTGCGYAPPIGAEWPDGSWTA